MINSSRIILHSILDIKDRGKALNYILFIVAIVLGAPSWLLVKFQVPAISAEFSIGLRFLLAGIVLEITRIIIKGPSVKLSFRNWQLIIMQGIFLYSINFWLCYNSSLYIASGLIAVTVSSMIILNLLFGKLFLNVAFSLQNFIGALIGVFGVFILFVQEIYPLEESGSLLKGFSLAFLSTFFSAIGTQISGKISKKQIPILFSTSRALFIGGLISLITSLIKEGWPVLPQSFEFWGSLLYLAIFSSAISYILYGYLIKKYGPGVASYLWILSPTISLALSAIFEAYQWTIISTMGLLFILSGGILTAQKVFRN